MTAKATARQEKAHDTGDTLGAMVALVSLRATSGAQTTPGLADAVIRDFLGLDSSLALAIDMAEEAAAALDAMPDRPRRMDEASLVAWAQGDLLSFYGEAARSPYVPLAAKGPWIVTTHGAVLHDSGGYGMLGLGHSPDAPVEALAKSAVMANVMTPSLSQRRFTDRLGAAIGGGGGCPYSRFICLNSGSEAVTLASRICDIVAFEATGPGGPHAGQKIKLLSLEGSFHGRTTSAAWLSHSTREIYRANLASFRDRDLLVVVSANDVAALEACFARAEAEGFYIAAFFIEPVAGEGVPGRAITREFYDAARRLTLVHGCPLVVDSIQAGLRAQGVLSIVDYPGFEGAAPPDMETFSKAINAGQFPLSVLALTPSAAARYVSGVYGNTMTSNPRGLEVGVAVLDAMTPALAQNIRARGAELKARLEALAADPALEGAIVSVEGTGLIVCAELAETLPVNGVGGVEEALRKAGIAMIHGGVNGLRFTPHFAITSHEIELILSIVREVLLDRYPARDPE